MLKFRVNLCLLMSAVVLAAGCDAEPAAEPPAASFPAHAVNCRILVDTDAHEERRSIAPNQNVDSAVADGKGQGDWVSVPEGSNAATELATIESALTRETGGRTEVSVAASEYDVTGKHISAYYPGGAHLDDGRPAIVFDLTPDGKIQIANLTAHNIGRRLAIIVDGAVWAVPEIESMVADRFMLSFPIAALHDRVAAQLNRLQQGVTKP